MVSVNLLVQQLVNGLFFGGQLALLAVGLTLIYGVGRVLNFAHGGVFMLGGYAGLFAIEYTGSWAVAIPAAVGVTFLLGVGIETALVRRLRDRTEFDLASIIATLGLWIVLENGMRLLVGSSQQSIEPMVSDVWIVGSTVVNVQRLVIFVISVAAIGGLFVLIQYTRFGLGLRAAAEDDQVTRLMGVNMPRMYALTFGLSTALAGLAGVLLAPIFSVYPAVGNRPFLLAFIVVIIGGLGSVRGTLIAALFIALVRSLSLIWLSSQGATIVLFAIMAMVLMVSPEGIGRLVRT